MARGQKHGRRCPCQRCDERWNSDGYYSADPPTSTPSYEDGRWQEGDTTYTVDAANDPKVQGQGYFLSQQDDKGNKATAVYNEDDTFADTKANKDWT